MDFYLDLVFFNMFSTLLVEVLVKESTKFWVWLSVLWTCRGITGIAAIALMLSNSQNKFYITHFSIIGNKARDLSSRNQIISILNSTLYIPKTHLSFMVIFLFGNNTFIFKNYFNVYSMINRLQKLTYLHYTSYSGW